jgi:hypothetical protein
MRRSSLWNLVADKWTFRIDAKIIAVMLLDIWDLINSSTSLVVRIASNCAQIFTWLEISLDSILSSSLRWAIRYVRKRILGLDIVNSWASRASR